MENTHNNFILKTATHKDIPLLHRLFKASVRHTCNRHYAQAQIDAWINKATPARWEQLFHSDLHFIIAITIEQEIAGFTSVNTQGYLHSMFVHPDYQHQGAASLLLSAAEDFTRQQHVASIHSEVSITARPFFEKRGYQVEKEQTVELDSIKMINFVMRKQL